MPLLLLLSKPRFRHNTGTGNLRRSHFCDSGYMSVKKPRPYDICEDARQEREKAFQAHLASEIKTNCLYGSNVDHSANHSASWVVIKTFQCSSVPIQSKGAVTSLATKDRRIVDDRRQSMPRFSPIGEP
jgi:hypothetical protein